jgi:hypothetical protein
MTAHLSADEPEGNVQGTGYPAVAGGSGGSRRLI